MENNEYCSHKFCDICGGVMVRAEEDGMTGWLCTDPDCLVFEPDPI